MSEYIYLKQPGILCDMMFALKLRFNGERAYIGFKNHFSSYSENVKLFERVISDLSEISNKLLPLFYWREAEVSTGLIEYINAYWDELHCTDEDNFLENFYASLCDVHRLKKFIYTNYVSNDCPDIINITSFSQIRNNLFAADLPDDVKMYMMDFFLYGEQDIELIISNLRKVQAYCEEIYQINKNKVNELVSRFNSEKLSIVSNIHSVDISKYDTIYFTYSVINVYVMYGRLHGTKWISYLGLYSDEALYTYSTDVKIGLYDLGRILYDETRLKILKMLYHKEMYCAEIARELGLKNNSTLYHLIMMEREHLLVNRSVGKKILYRINTDYLKAAVRDLESYLKGE